MALSQAGASSWTLSRSWDAYLGPAQEGSLYRSAVCGDGSLYLTDAHGRVMLLNAAGKMQPACSGPVRTSNWLDADLRLKATGIPVAGYGQLQGSPDDGSLYFSRISTAQGIHVIKATLLAQQQASTEIDAAR